MIEQYDLIEHLNERVTKLELMLVHMQTILQVYLPPGVKIPDIDTYSTEELSHLTRFDDLRLPNTCYRDIPVCAEDTTYK